MNTALKLQLIEAMAQAIASHVEELTSLDQAIGDGDHGFNMKRGFDALLADGPSLAAKPLPDALQAIGMQLVMKIGGASGPLYGTLAMAFGKAFSVMPDAANAAQALHAAIEAVKARGKSEVGQKTMLDVLVPVQAVLAQGGGDLPRRIEDAAANAATATIPLRATRGRASFLGDRSIGHMDPGARSSWLIIAAICGVLDGTT